MPKTRASRAPAFETLSVAAKPAPSQQRGKETYEMILATAGQLIGEIGFEKLSTNLVCQRAGMTPPALYRYFPNKYALLVELARRLMDAQDNVLFSWLESGGNRYDSVEEAVEKSCRLRKELIRVTRAQPGGMWILRAIRAVPALQEVRVVSRNKVLERQFEMLRARYPDIAVDQLHTAIRLSEQMAYATIEMIVEDPDLDEDNIIREISWMTSLYYQQLASRAKKVSSTSGKELPAQPSPKMGKTRANNKASIKHKRGEDAELKAEGGGGVMTPPVQSASRRLGRPQRT